MNTVDVNIVLKYMLSLIDHYNYTKDVVSKVEQWEIADYLNKEVEEVNKRIIKLSEYLLILTRET